MSVAVRFDRLAGPVAFAVPWVFGLLNVSGSATWSDDLAVARAFGASPYGFEGLVSSGLAGLVAWVPVGTPLSRAASLSALALAAASLLLFRLSRQLLLSCGARPHALLPFIALLSALTATLGPAFVAAGTLVGGGTVAAALGLAALERNSQPFSPRSALLTGAFVALCLCESRWTGLVVVGALVASWAARKRELSVAVLSWVGAGALGIGLLPAALAVGFASSSGSGLAGLWATRSSLSFSLDGAGSAVADWIHGAGFIWAGLSLLGLGLALLRRSARSLACGLLALLVAGALESVETSPIVAAPVTGARLLGIATLALTTGVGLSFLVERLGRARLPFARAAGALLLVYGFSLVFVSAENASRETENRGRSLAEHWTDEAWLSLPPKSLLLVRSEAVFLRLMSSRTLAGSRPDVLIVPTSALDQSSVQLDLVEREAALVPIVRDVLLTGKPSELALTGLADTRPMYVELDPSWDSRLYPHLVPHAFFSEFSPHPLGRSDRNAGVEAASERFAEVASAVRSTPGRDPATREVLGSSLSQRAILLEALGDRAAAMSVNEELLALRADHPVGRALRARFAGKSNPSFDVRALLASR